MIFESCEAAENAIEEVSCDDQTKTICDLISLCAFFCAWHWLRLVAGFAGIVTICMLSHARHQTPVKRFPALGTGWLFPHLAARSLTLGTGCLFSRSWHRLHIFLRLALVPCFPGLGTGCLFSHPWH